MSTLIVPIAEIDAVKAHPNADRLEIAVIKGWQVIVGKGTYQPGDRVIYVPPDAVVPAEWSDRWNVTKYLSNGRVRCTKLRGEPSFGFTAPINDLPEHIDQWDTDLNVADLFGITKYDPPVKVTAGDAMPDHALFVKYTDIENLRHFPNVLTEGEPVVMTEKIHGTNVRIGVIEGEVMAGSHRLRRARPENPATSHYWFPLTILGVEQLLHDLGQRHKQVILYGETYGRVQALHYGIENGVSFRAFDLLVDGRYLDWEDFRALCDQYAIPTVPVVHAGAFSLESAKAHSEGGTLVGGSHYREGVVVKPYQERTDPAVGRVVLKYVSDTYLLGGKDDPSADA